MASRKGEYDRRVQQNKGRGRNEGKGKRERDHFTLVFEATETEKDIQLSPRKVEPSRIDEIGECKPEPSSLDGSLSSCSWFWRARLKLSRRRSCVGMGLKPSEPQLTGMVV
jgi:hypothetical protein